MLNRRVLLVVLMLIPVTQVCRSPLGPMVAQDAGRDVSWDRIDGDDWNYLRRGSSKDDEIVADASAPFSPPDVLKIVFTPDMGRDQEPSVHWTPLDNAADVEAIWWIKLSANWTASPAGGGKMTFLHLAPDGKGQVYSNIGGSRPPHEVTINTEWAPYGQRVWEPNRTKTPIVYDRWYRIAWEVALPTGHGRDTGVLRWWVDGDLNGEYTDVRTPLGVDGFQQFEFAPTIQNPPPQEQYMFVDHTSIRVKDHGGHRSEP